MGKPRTLAELAQSYEQLKPSPSLEAQLITGLEATVRKLLQRKKRLAALVELFRGKDLTLEESIPYLDYLNSLQPPVPKDFGKPGYRVPPLRFSEPFSLPLHEPSKA